MKMDFLSPLGTCCSRANRNAVFTFVLLLLLWATTGKAQTCDSYPIAVSAQSLSGLTNGAILDVLQGAQPGNFGWLTWGGSPSAPTLVKSLSVPGNSSDYINPDHPDDHQFSAGKWVHGRPGASNSKNVRDALNALTNMDITIPVWDQARGQGATAAYHITAFARVRLTSYQLPQQNRITARFLGYSTCSALNQAPKVSVGSDQNITLPGVAVLNGVVTDDGMPVGGTLTAIWSVANGPGTVVFSNAHLTNALNGSPVTNEITTTATFTVAGTYILTLTASDSQLTASNSVIITVDHQNRAPIANPQSVSLNENTATNITLTGSDPDGDALSYLVVTLPNYGTLSGTPPHLVYTPKPDYSGDDDFSFKVNDGGLDSAPVTVSITVVHVNVPPIADEASVTNNENISFNIILSGSDTEGSPLTFQVLVNPTNGNLTGTAPNLTYTPNTNYFGADTLTFAANDGLTNSAPAVVHISILPVDEQPEVVAGPDQFIVLPTNTVSLSGIVTYTVFPGTVDTVEWSKVSGPGVVTFSNASNEVTTAAFSESGVYQLQLMASDSFLASSNELTITVDAPPVVVAGVAQTNTLPGTVLLNGSVTDDRIPTNGVLSAAWSKVSGPGTVVFSTPHQTNTSVSFSESGIYVLQLTADDGAVRSSDQVSVMVNQAPIVDAGASQTITNLEVLLTGSVFDDGLPNGTPSIIWSQISGPGTVTFANSNALVTTASFSETGVYHLLLTATDSLAVVSNETVITVDGAPNVAITGDQLVNFPSTAALNATATDDGLPVGSTLGFLWSQVSGPGVVKFSDSSALTSTASFSTSGVYVVRFSANDSLLSSSTNWTVVANATPSVSAGEAQVITLPDIASVVGVVSDDGLPNTNLTLNWSKVSGPGIAAFASPNSAVTTVSFNASGSYVLQLTAYDGASSNSSTVTIIANQRPVVDAGSNQITSIPNSQVTLNGNVTDDGFPNGVLSITWSVISGTGTVSFGSPAAAVSTAVFSGPGVYVLQLTGSDGISSSSDTATVTVNDSPTVVVTSPDVITWPSNQVTLHATATDDGLPMGGVLHSVWSQVSGPATSTFSSVIQTAPLSGTAVSNSPSTAVTFSAPGLYVLRLSVDDGLVTNFTDVSATVNQAPVVNSGSSQTITLPNNIVTLHGTVTDDGLPLSSSITSIWTQDSGPGVVVFSDPAALNATATFSTNGSYVLRLVANDGVSSNSATVNIFVNQGPAVAVATAAVVTWPSNQVTLQATTTDDGFPNGGSLQSLWSQLSGPGTASFVALSQTTPLLGSAVTNSLSTVATFSAPGLYLLRLTINDGLTTNFAEVSVTVNRAPVISAGSDQTITLPNNQVTLNATATDDGLPTGSSVTVAWMQASGPGTVSFGDATALVTTATFSTNGVYVLTIVASDSVSSNSSSLTVVVNEAITVTLAPAPVITWPSNQVTLAGIVTDDGLPSGQSLNEVWTQVSGPGLSSFTPSNRVTSLSGSPISDSVSTVVAFTTPGLYVVRLTATDGLTTNFADAAVTVNRAPIVDAGVSQTIVSPNNQVTLNGTVTDDGLPVGNSVVASWTKVSGSGTVSFGNAAAAVTTSTFSAPGTYSLRFTATDGVSSSSSDVAIIVDQAPSVSLSTVSVITWPTNQVVLNGTVIDDGLPAGKSLNQVWTQVSGPGVAVFAPNRQTNLLIGAAITNLPSTAVTFSAPGSYVLRLTVDDGVATNSANVTVRLNQAPVATPFGVSVTEGQNVSILLGGTDADGDSLTFALAGSPTSGVLSGTPPNLTYTPNAGSFGTDTIKFTVNDGFVTSATADVSVVVNPIPRSRTYTTTADFQSGQYFASLLATNGQLMLRSQAGAFNNLWVAVSSKGTIVRIDTETGEVKGEYWSAPQGQPMNPSRTTVDLNGSVWAGNRAGNSVVHISVADSGLWTDRNHNGILDTSTGLGDVKPWPNTGGVDSNGGVSTSQDELVLHYVKVTASGTRHVSVNSSNNVWVGGTGTKTWDLVDGITGQIIRHENSVGYGGYGGLIDHNNVIWSSNPLLRWDTSKPLTGANGGNWKGYSDPSYGIGVDSKGNVWVSSLGSGKIMKIAPDGTILGRFYQGSANAQGVAVDLNDHVWVASSLINGTTVAHLKNDGTFVGNVKVGQGPTGVAVDMKGQIWVAHNNSGNVMRIDPNSGPYGADGVTPVGLVSYVSPYLGGNLYNYSDMTGSTLSSFPGQGIWSVVYDSTIPQAHWGPVAWNCKIYDDGQVKVTIATSEDGISYGSAETISKPNGVPSSVGRYAKLTVTFVRSYAGQGPVLDDITFGTDGYAAPVIQPLVTVDAGANHNLQLPLADQLQASLAHNGFLTYNTNQPFTWMKVSGPGTVTFGNTNAAATSARFSTAGVYVLRAQTALSNVIYSADVQVTAAPVNYSPWADVGAHRVIRSTNDVLHINATAQDDGLPNGILNLQWSKIIGPGNVTFSPTTIASTNIPSGQPIQAPTDLTFTAPGIYILQLVASDGLLSYSNRLEVRVQAVCTVAAPSGLAQWWPGNADTAETVRGNSMILQNGATFAAAQVSHGYLFNGTTNFAKAFEHPNLDIGSADGLTIEFWIKGFTSGRVFGWSRNGTNGIYADYDASNGSLALHLVDTNNTDHLVSFLSAVSTSQFRHLAITYDKVTGYVTFYVNGIVAASSNVGILNARTTGDFYFAGDAQTASRFGGIIDEFTLYNRALNGQEINEIAQATFVGKCPNNENLTPVVNGGGNITVAQPGEATVMRGAVSDDGLPIEVPLLSQWRVVSGPGTVGFANSNNPTSSATFSAAGIYVLKLYADDGEKASSDLIEARVNTLCTLKDTPGLVGWWPGNNTGLDVLGGNSAELINGTTFADGRVSSCFKFDGVNNYCRIQGNSSYDIGMSTDGWTIEMWVNGSSPGSGNKRGILNWNNGTAVGLQLYQDGPNLRVTQVEPNGTVHSWNSGGDVIAGAINSTWHHIAVTYDRGLGLGRGYLDGVLVYSAIVGSYATQTSYDLQLAPSLGFGQYLGLLDELSLYRRSLNPQEVYSLYASGSAGKCPTDGNQPPVVYAGSDLFVRGVPGVVILNGMVSDDGLPVGSSVRAQWSKLSGPGNVTFSDTNAGIASATFSTNGIYVLQLTADDGEIQSRDIMEVRVETLCTVANQEGLAAWWSGNGTSVEQLSGAMSILGSGTSFSAGKVAMAFQFDGANDFVVMAASTNYDIGTSMNGWTIEMWVDGLKIDNGHFRGLLNWTNGTAVGLQFSQSAGALQVTQVEPNGTVHNWRNGGEFIPGAFSANTAAWHHIAVTYDRGLGLARGYLDGVLVYSEFVGSYATQTSYDLRLGPTVGDGPYAGLMDELSLYRRPLNPQEIYSLFASGSAGKCPTDGNQPPVVYAGSNFSLLSSTNVASLTGFVTDDGLPLDSTVRIQWSKVSGPGSVTFNNSNSAVTKATFGTNGIYTLRLTADDGEILSSSTVEARVAVSCSANVLDIPGLVGWWPANGTSVDRVTGREAVLGNGTGYTAGKVAAAFQFDGANNFVVMPASTNYDIGTSTNGWTIEMWVNGISFGSGHFRGVLNWNNGTAVGLQLYQNGPGLLLTQVEPNGTAHPWNSGGTVIAGAFTSTPHHIAVTYDRGLGLAGAYLDGVLVYSAIVGSYATQTSYDLRLAPNFGEGPYSGQIDELSLYQRALSSNEVQAIVSAGANGKCMTPVNQPPMVLAGGNRVVYFPTNTITLHGSVVDDALPSNSLTLNWSCSSGTNNILFGDTNAAVTTVTFTNTGVYVFQLTARDGQYTVTNTAVITVLDDPRVPPTISLTSPAAGSIRIHSQGTNLTLTALVSDADDAIARVDFYVNGTNLTTLNNGPYLVTLSNLLAGSYTFTAVATDFSGLSATSAPVNVTLFVATNAPTVSIISPAPGAALEVPVNGTRDFSLIATASDGDGSVATAKFYQNGSLLASLSNAPYIVGVTNLPVGNYAYTVVATDDDGLSTTSAPVLAVIFVDAGAPTVSITSPADASTATAPLSVIGTASSPILASYQVQYRFKVPEQTSPYPWVTLTNGGTSVLSGSLGVFDPTVLLNGVYEIQLTATDQKGRTSSTDIQTVVVDRNMKLGNFTISYNDLEVPVPGLPLQITRTYDSRAAAAGTQGDFGVGWTLDIRNVRLQKNRPLGRNWQETFSGGLFPFYAFDPVRERIVTITFADGRVQKFRFEPEPMTQLLLPIDFPEWNFVPIGNTRGTLTPASIDEEDGSFLITVGSVPGPVDLYDLNFFSGNITANDQTLNSYPTLFRYTSPEGFKYLIDEVEGLKSVTDPNGNTLVVNANGLTWANTTAGTNTLSVLFKRDQAGRITNIVDAAGHAMNYSYSANSNLTTFSDRTAQVNSFAYTNAAYSHFLTGITDGRGTNALQNLYGADGRIVGETDAAGNTTRFGIDPINLRESVTNRLGFVTINQYDTLGRLIRKTDPAGLVSSYVYDNFDNLLSVSNSTCGCATHYTYDALDNLTSETDELGRTTQYTYTGLSKVLTFTDSDGNTTTNSYDARGNLLSTRDPLGSNTSFTYNNMGKVLTMTDPRGGVTTFVYDSNGNLAEETDPLGNSTTYTTDLNGNLTGLSKKRTLRFTTPVASLFSLEPNALFCDVPLAEASTNVVATYSYDADGRLTSAVLPDGSTIQNVFNGINQIAASIDQLGQTTATDYNELGKTSRISYPDGTSETMQYDAEGQLTRHVDRGDRLTQFSYDSNGRLNRATYTDGRIVTATYDFRGQLIAETDSCHGTTSYEYDAVGNRTSSTDALGHKTSYTYNAKRACTSVTDALGHVKTMEYDVLNRNTRIIYPNGNSKTSTYFGKQAASITDEQGKTSYFGYDALGHPVSGTNALGQVTRFRYDEMGNRVMQTDPQGETTTHEYDNLGRRVRSVSPDGSTQQFAYDSLGRMISTVDAAGKQTRMAYDARNNIVAITNALGAVTRFTYNPLGQRTSKTDSNGKVTQWQYDTAGRLTHTQYPDGSTEAQQYDSCNRLSAIVDRTGGVSSYTYNQLDQVVSSSDSLNRISTFGYDAVGNLVSHGDPAGQVTQFLYDSLNRQTGMVLPDGTSVTQNYDPTGRMASRIDQLGRSTQYTYDANGRVLSMVDPLGRATSYTYDVRGNLATVLDALGQQTSYVYDENGRIKQTIQPDGSSGMVAYDARGLVLTQTDALGHQTHFGYDDLGQRTSVTNALGNVTRYSYDLLGRVTSLTDANGHVTSYQYDEVGRLTRTTYADGTSSSSIYDAAGRKVSVTDARGNLTQYSYDLLGHMVRMTNALNQVVTLDYDNLGRRTQQTDALGHVTHFEYDVIGHLTRKVNADATFSAYIYDAAGRRTATVDEASLTNYFGYDALDRLTSVTNALGAVTLYSYDAVGQLLSQTDANNHTTTYSYDAVGHRTRRTLPAGEVETFAYDLAGNLTNYTDFNGRVCAYDFDALNEPVRKTADPFFGEPPVTWAFDPVGLRTNMTDAAGSTSWQYDAQNRLSTKTRIWATTTNEFSGTLNYAYDAVGNVTNIASTAANGVALAYAYDALNRLDSVRDPLNGTTTYAYDPAGNLATLTRPNSLQTTYAYDTRNRATSVTTIDASLAMMSQYLYANGATGNRLGATDSVVVNGQTNTLARGYAYDAAYRLTGETITANAQVSSLNYTYDAAGNRSTRTSTLAGLPNQSFTYDANDRLTTDTYDANGNTLSGTVSPSLPTVNDTYDQADRLVKRQSSLGTATFQYDGDGNRVGKTVGGVTTHFLVDEMNPTGWPQVLEERTWNPSGPTLSTPSVTRVYTYGHAALAQDQLTGNAGSGFQWSATHFGHDAHGNVRSLTDSTGHVTDTFDYDAFGNVIGRSGTTAATRMFTGEEFDADLGLYNLRARYHNPSTGRFWTRDTYEGGIDDPGSLHGYSYVQNNPVNRRDPSGHFALADTMATAAMASFVQPMVDQLFRGTMNYVHGLGGGSLLKANNLREGLFIQSLSQHVGANLGRLNFYATMQGAPFLLVNSPFLYPVRRCDGSDAYTGDPEAPIYGCMNREPVFRTDFEHTSGYQTATGLFQPFLTAVDVAGSKMGTDGNYEGYSDTFRDIYDNASKYDEDEMRADMASQTARNMLGVITLGGSEMAYNASIGDWQAVRDQTLLTVVTLGAGKFAGYLNEGNIIGIDNGATASQMRAYRAQTLAEWNIERSALEGERSLIPLKSLPPEPRGFGPQALTTPEPCLEMVKPKNVSQKLLSARKPPAGLLKGPSQGRMNAVNGNKFQREVHKALRLPENTAKVSGNVKGVELNTEPDLLGERTGVTDVKNVEGISFGKQLQAQYDYARQNGMPFNLIISPNTDTVSGPLQRAIMRTGGQIFEFNSSTGTFRDVTFSGSQVVR